MTKFKKYLSLRLDGVSIDRVFLKYKNGRCINTIGRCHALIAGYLKLPHADKYTGHAFRRTCATIMANEERLSMK